MAEGKVAVYRPGEGSLQTVQTTGITREELVSNPDTWVGMAYTQPGFTSGWHHHGDYDTYVYLISGEIKFEFGKDGQESCVVKAGEVGHIPKNTVHRESNPSTEEQVIFLVRVGKGAPVFNIERP